MRPAKPENGPVFDYAQRRARVGERMQRAGVYLLFLPISGDLEYLTGIPRREPSFGNVAYRHGWVAGAFLRPGADPVVVLPRMITEAELASEVNLEMARRGSRVESFDTGIISTGRLDQRDAGTRLTTQPIREGTSVSFDFGAVVDGYCSDFGRTIFVGEPDAEFRRVYELVIASQAAGIKAARPGG